MMHTIMKLLNPTQPAYGAVGTFIHCDDFLPVPAGPMDILTTAANGNMYHGTPANNDKWKVTVTLPLGRMVLMIRGWQSTNRGEVTATLNGVALMTQSFNGSSVNDIQYYSAPFTNGSSDEQELVLTVNGVTVGMTTYYTFLFSHVSFIKI